MDETGLFEISNGDLTTLVHVGAVDAPEFKAMISTTDTLKPVADKTKGLVARVVGCKTARSTCRRSCRCAARSASPTTTACMIRMTDETVLKGINTLPLFAGFAGVGVLLLAFGAMWWREGR